MNSIHKLFPLYSFLLLYFLGFLPKTLILPLRIKCIKFSFLHMFLKNTLLGNIVATSEFVLDLPLNKMVFITFHIIHHTTVALH